MLCRYSLCGAVLSVALAACSDCGEPPATEQDAAAVDAGRTDARGSDVRAADRAVRDARQTDAAMPDQAVVDSAVADTARPHDAAAPDQATADTATADSARTDDADPGHDVAVVDAETSTDAMVEDVGAVAPAFAGLLQHAADGTVEQGSVAAVLDVMARGGEIKVRYDDWLVTCQQTWNRDDTVAGCETWFPFVVADDASHFVVDASPQWWIAAFNSNGIVDHAQYLIEAHSATRNEIASAGLQWLGRTARQEIYRADAAGTAISGSLDHLIQLVRAGAVATCRPTRPATTLVTGDGTGVAMLDSTHVSLDSYGSGLAIQDAAYHFFWWTNTDGFSHHSRWYIGAPSFISSTTGNDPLSWFAEPQWQQVLQLDASGQAQHGSLTQLVAAAQDGHSIRVELEPDVFYPCAVVELSEAQDAVACRVLDGLTWSSWGNDIVNADALQRDYRVASTTGLVQTERYPIATASFAEQSSSAMAQRWFSDGARWELALATGSGGTVTGGSKAALLAAAQAGADVKVRLQTAGAGVWVGECRALRFEATAERVACVAWDVELGLAGAATPAYRLIVVNEDGVVSSHRIGFGTTQSLGATTAAAAEVRWLVRQ